MPVALVRVIGNKQLAEAEARRRAEVPQDTQALTGLAGHIERAWQAAQTAKMPIERRMLQALRQRTGIYESDDLALIRQQGGSEIFMMLTSAKCRGAESWLREVLQPETDRAWGLSPTPLPDLPPPVMQAIIQSVFEMAMAAGWAIDDQRIDERLLKIKFLAFKRMKDISEKIAERMELKIADQFAQGGWDDAVSDMIYDLVTFPASFIKGPVLRMRPQRQWLPGPNGTWISDVKVAPRIEWERRSPFDIYPSPAMRNIKSGNLIDRYRYTREEFQAMRGLPGYSDEAIRRIIERYGERGYRSTMVNDAERARVELRENEEYDPEGTIEALNFWGSMSGHMLKQWSYDNRVDLGMTVETHKEYQVEAWKTAGEVFKATINPDQLGEKPYTKASFEEIPGAFWGYGIPDLMKDCQRMCNAAARAVSNNAAIASGPQVEVMVDRLADGEKITQPHPWKVWQTTSDLRASGGHNPAIQFFQPQMNVSELMLIFDRFERTADNVTGFPNYTYGDSRVGGAGRTSSGLAQLLGNVGKGVRRVVQCVDRNHIRVHVGRTYNFNMEFDPDPTIKGDLVPVPKGTVAYLARDTARQRQMEMLQATMNPLDAQIIGVQGRAEMLRAALKSADFDATKIVPDGLDLELAAASMPPPHMLLGKTGPNGPSTPGVGGGEGGTPEAPNNIDDSGADVNGTQQREASLGMKDGGPVRRRHVRLRRSFDQNGAATLDIEDV